jgi:hypothetical protein
MNFVGVWVVGRVEFVAGIFLIDISISRNCLFDDRALFIAELA